MPKSLDPRQRAFRIWYAFALTAGGAQLPLMLIFVFLVHAPVGTSATLAYLVILLPVFAMPMIRFKFKGQREGEGWKTTLLALLWFHVGIGALGWVAARPLSFFYLDHTPLAWHKWVGVVVFVPFFAALVYLDQRLRGVTRRL